MKHLVVLFSVSALAILAVPVASAEQAGCPSGYELIGIDDPESPGQVVTAHNVDAAGNNDGFVCRAALGDGIFHAFPGRPDTVYHWRDNKG